METYTRENSHVGRVATDLYGCAPNFIAATRRGTSRPVSTGRSGFMRHLYHTMGGSEKWDVSWQRCPEKIRKWAYKNALTLTFMSAMFIVTWLLMVTLYVAGSRP